ncbi:translocon subunit [Dinochytrium kinnereticum]|nr:translocon subunit [Dinochytrium kinnereticum]
MYWMRMILGSSRGTLMELGVSPIVTSAMVLQLLAGAGVVDVDFGVRDERALFGDVQKLFALIIAVAQASILVLSGIYGEPSEIGAGICAAIIGQLLGATVVTVLLDELLQKGYGLGSGIALFSGVKISEGIVWKSLSPVFILTAKGREYEGALMNLFSLLFTRKDKFLALKEAVFRSTLPNVAGVVATLLVFAAMAYLQTVRYEIRVSSNRVRGQGGNYPIKLLHTGTMPVLLVTAVVSNVYFVSQSYDGGRQQFASGGLVYYISPPHSLTSALSDPLHLIVYTALMLSSCAYISKYWMEVSGTTARDVAKIFQDQQLSIQGHRDSNAKNQLAKIISPVAVLGALTVAALAVAAEVAGAVGGGVGVVVVISSIFGYVEIFAREQQESPFMADLF